MRSDLEIIDEDGKSINELARGIIGRGWVEGRIPDAIDEVLSIAYNQGLEDKGNVMCRRCSDKSYKSLPVLPYHWKELDNNLRAKEYDKECRFRAVEPMNELLLIAFGTHSELGAAVPNAYLKLNGLVISITGWVFYQLKEPDIYFLERRRYTNARWNSGSI